MLNIVNLQIGNLLTRGNKVEEVTSFCYLGSKITQDGLSKKGIRIAQTEKAFFTGETY